MIPAWSVVVAVALCVVSAVAYAAGALLQQQAAAGPVLRNPRWWLGMSSNGLGAVLHVVALRYGSLTLVQALGALTLVAAVPLAAAVARRRVTRAELTGTALTTGALVALVAVSGSSSQALSVREGVAVSLAAGAIMAWAALRPRLPGLGAAAVGGMGFGVASALTQAVTLRLGAGVAGIVAGVAAVAALNVAAVWFTQRSYRTGLAAPLAVGTVANPVTAAVIGVAMLQQRFLGGAAGVVVVLACAVVLAAGVFMLARAQAQPTTQPQKQTPLADSAGSVVGAQAPHAGSVGSAARAGVPQVGSVGAAARVQVPQARLILRSVLPRAGTGSPCAHVRLRGRAAALSSRSRVVGPVETGPLISVGARVV